MKLVYLAGKYRDKRGAFYVDQNIQAARTFAGKLWSMGLAVLCPHLNTAHFDGLVGADAFLEGTLEMMRRCDALVLLPGWEKSAGSRSEKAEAERMEMPVFILPLDMDDLREWVTL